MNDNNSVTDYIAHIIETLNRLDAAFKAERWAEVVDHASHVTADVEDGLSAIGIMAMEMVLRNARTMTEPIVVDLTDETISQFLGG